MFEDSAVQSGSPIATGETTHPELFCDFGGLYVPDGEQWACQNCQQTRAELSGEFTLQTPREPRELDIMAERFFLGPKTWETCPVCEHGRPTTNCDRRGVSMRVKPGSSPVPAVSTSGERMTDSTVAASPWAVSPVQCDV